MAVSAADRLVQAERILADLERRLDEAKDQKRTLAQRRRQVSYGAHAGTVPFAGAELEALRRRTIENEMALEDLPFAIEGARQAVQAAEADVAEEQPRARQTLPTVARLRAAAEAADAAADELITRLREVGDVALELARSNFGLPRAQLYRLAAERGVQTTLATLGLAPRVKRDERTTITVAVGKLADQAEARLHRLAGDPLPEGLAEPEPDLEPEEDDLELVGAEPEPGAGLSEEYLMEAATAASDYWNQLVELDYVREVAEAWLPSTAEAADPVARWIVSRLKARNSPAGAQFDEGC